MKVPIYFLLVFFFSFSVLAQRSVQLSADGGLALGNYAGWTGSAGISLPKGFLFSFQYDNLKRERKGLFPNITIVDSLSEPNLRTVLVYSAIEAYSVMVGKRFDLTGTDEFLVSFEGGISALKTTLPSAWQQINDPTFGRVYYLDYMESWTPGFITRLKLLLPMTDWSAFHLSTTCNINSQSTYAFVSGGFSLNIP